MKILLKTNILQKETRDELMPFSFCWIGRRLFFVGENVNRYFSPSNNTSYSVIEIKHHKNCLFIFAVSILTAKNNNHYSLTRLENITNPSDRIAVWHEAFNSLFVTLRNDRDIINSIFDTSIIPFLVNSLENIPQKATLYILNKSLELIIWDTFLLRGILEQRNKLFLAEIELIEKSSNRLICSLPDINLSTHLYLEGSSLDEGTLEEMMETVPEEDLIDIFLTALKTGIK